MNHIFLAAMIHFLVTLELEDWGGAVEEITVSPALYQAVVEALGAPGTGPITHWSGVRIRCAS